MTKSNPMIGVGLRHEHLFQIDKSMTEAIQWFEVHTENFVDNFGEQREILIDISKDYPISLHGVGLSIVSAKDFDRFYLNKVKKLADEVNAFRLSDHLSWSASNKVNFHTLLPFIYNDDYLNYVADKLSYLQDYFKRPFSVENITYYLEFKESTMREAEFINKVLDKSKTKLLLDINNVYVNAKNFNRDPKEFIDEISAQHISQIHLAGFSNIGSFLYDTHSRPIYDEVWDLLEYTLKTKNIPHTPILIEWDNNVPEFDVLEIEAKKAEKIWREVFHV